MDEEAQVMNRQNFTQLMNALQGTDMYGSLQAIDSLGKIGMPAVAPLVELLTTGSQNVRWRSAMALARTGTASVEPLIEIASGRDVSVRNPAIWALAEIGSPKAVEPLVRILQNEESECCRILTAAALLKINDPAGIDAVNREYERFGEEFRGRVDEAFAGS